VVCERSFRNQFNNFRSRGTKFIFHRSSFFSFFLSVNPPTPTFLATSHSSSSTPFQVKLSNFLQLSFQNSKKETGNIGEKEIKLEDKSGDLKNGGELDMITLLL